MRRLGLLIFGSVFLALFVVVAAIQGVGNPNVPAGVAAIVEDAPADTGEISETRFRQALEQVAAQSGEKEPPKPGDPKYDELAGAAMKMLVEAVWLQGLAAELGIEITDQEVAEELRKVKKENFGSEAEYQEYLKEAQYTQKDINELLKAERLGKEVQAALKADIPEPSKREIENYYAAAKSTEFTHEAARDIRLVVNRDRKKAQEAANALVDDDSSKSWGKVAAKLSQEAATNESGGEQDAVAEGSIEEPLNAAVFSAPQGKLEGPINTHRGYTVFEVVKLIPKTVEDLEEAKPHIQSILAPRAEQEFFAAYVVKYQAQWIARTFCASGYITPSCANFKGDGHPLSAPEACYEADPDGGRPEACPAAVVQLTPALPGSVTPLKPQGDPMAQRAVPAGGEGAEPSAAEAELAEGAVPPVE